MASVGIKLRRLVMDANGTVGPGTPVYRAMERAGRKVTDEAKRNLSKAGRVDTGRLRQSGTYRIERKGVWGITALVEFSTDYAVFIHEGTANAGAGFIYPRRANLLRFKPKGGSSFVYARRVRGIKPTPFLTDALNSLTVKDIEP